MAESIANVVENSTASEDAGGDLCALCREEKKQPKNLDCGHSFCGACLEDFKGYRNKNWGRCCPLCRQPISGTSNAVRNALLIDLTLSSDDESPNAQNERTTVSSSDSSTDNSTSDDSSSTTTDTETSESSNLDIEDFGNLVYVDEYELAYFESNILSDDELYFYTDSDDTIEGFEC